MALSSSNSPAYLSTIHSSSSSSSSSSLKLLHFHHPLTDSDFPAQPTSTISIHTLLTTTSLSASEKWRARVSFFPAFLNRGKDAQTLKEELLQAIAPLDRGAKATPEDQQIVYQVGSILFFLPLTFHLDF